MMARVAFFRPFVRDKEHDDDIEFFLERYSLDMRREQMYGYSVSEVEEFIANDKLDILLEGLVKRVKILESEYDFVLIEGLHQSVFSRAIDIDINLLVAKNLSAPYINILRDDNKTPKELLDDVRIDHDGIVLSGCTHFATFINRLNPDTKDTLSIILEYSNDLPPIYLLEEVSHLDMPNIFEVKQALGCEVIRTKPDDYKRVVKGIKIASMRLENFLEHIEDGDLVIVSSDRCDIITGSILAIESHSSPTISGIVLTGEMSLSTPIQNILDGLPNFPIPILKTREDTYTTAVAVESIQAQIRSKSERKIALAMGLFNRSVDLRTLSQNLAQVTSSIVTPIMFEHYIFQKAMQSKQRIILPEGEDDRILRATEALLHRGVADIILLGDESDISRKAASMGLDISGATIINPLNSEYRTRFAKSLYRLRRDRGMSVEGAYDVVTSPSYFGTMMVHFGYADGMVSGAIHTTQDTIRPALQIIKTQPNVDIVSSLFFMSMDREVLVYADCAINQDPTADELATIAISTADTAREFGIVVRVAMLSYSTGTSGKGADVDKVARATEIVKSKRPDILVEGPIQYDAAIDPEVAKVKLPQSKVAGRATIFIFPDLNTGNNTYKAVQRSSDAVAIGPILQGLKKPINDLSRGCQVVDIVNTVAITAIQAAQRSSDEDTSTKRG